jgi:hypothetical protein
MSATDYLLLGVLVVGMNAPIWVPGSVIGAVVAGPNQRLTGVVVGGVAQYALFTYVINPMVRKDNNPEAPYGTRF